MKGFTGISPFEIERAIELIGKDWMLISADDGEKVNTMTASWGCFGYLWNKPVVICFIRPQRYTFAIAEKSPRMSFCFFGEEYREALTYCGRVSGRDADKIKESGLTLGYNENNVPYFGEAKLVIFGRKLYSDYLKKDGFILPETLKNYPLDDFHKFYVCEIEAAMRKD